MTNISIIIPVYNAEKYLHKCLDSIINQTLSDIEIICINDGSTDTSFSILEEYAQKDNRIKIINRLNKGVSFTRNEGIRLSKGEYISFIDSDDYLEDNLFYEKLYNVAISEDAEIVKGNYKSEDDNSVWQELNKNIKSDKNNFCVQFASAIYKTSFLKENDILFPEINDMEDPVFAFRCALHSTRILTVDDAYYMVVTNPNSITRCNITYSQIIDKIKGLKYVVELANSSNISSDCYINVVGFWFIVVLKDILKNNNIFIKIFAINKMKGIYKNLKKDGDFEKYIENNKANNFIYLIIKSLLQTVFSVTNSYDKKYKRIVVLGFEINLTRSKHV